MKKFILVGACGLSCRLCPRHYTEGTSRCPGCGSEYRICVGCGFITCCSKKNIESCAQCDDKIGCERFNKSLDFAKDYDTFLSHKQIPANLEFIEKHGVEEFDKQEGEKQKILVFLLRNFDEGRSRSFYCAACTLLPFKSLGKIIRKTEAKIKATPSADIKSRANAMKMAIGDFADKLKVDLKLRKY